MQFITYTFQKQNEYVHPVNVKLMINVSNNIGRENKISDEIFHKKNKNLLIYELS